MSTDIFASSNENTTIEACKAAAAVLRMNEEGMKHKRRRRKIKSQQLVREGKNLYLSHATIKQMSIILLRHCTHSTQSVNLWATDDDDEEEKTEAFSIDYCRGC